MTYARTLADFLGHWTLTRQIDHANGPTATFSGRATWTVKDDDALYEEIGTLSVPGAQPMQAERRYLWRGLDVYFDDGRFFHKVPPQGGDARHWCDPDMYDVTYDFADWLVFTAIWKVAGPRKAYTLRSTYHRV